MDSTTPAARDQAEEPNPNRQRGALGDDDAVRRIEASLTHLGEQQLAMAKVLGALAARLPAAPAEADPIAELARAVQLRPKDPQAHLALGNRLMVLKHHVKAEVAYKNSIQLSPRVPLVHTNLGLVLQRQGKLEEAKQAFLDALALDPLCHARKFLTELLCQQRRFDEALAFWKMEMRAAPHDAEAARSATRTLLRADRLEEAAELAQRAAERAYRTRLWPKPLDEDPLTCRMRPQPANTSKLRHDIEQLEHLVARGIKTDELQPLVAGLRRVLERVAPLGDAVRSSLTQQERIDVGGYYNRIVHVAEAPRVPQALSYAWDMAKIEEDYVSRPPGIIHIDDLLSPEALAGLRKFCNESTIWTAAGYDNGYLGAYFADGFCAPLLVQIATELRAAMPRVIGDRRLVGLWAYKYDQKMSGISVHADMAAVNVNFWITPDEANLDPTSGGLVVYDVEAPQEWSFELYNGSTAAARDRIHEFLRTSNARAVEVPYKQNRAVIFNSDLFHHTAPLDFKPGYENRRVNVTLLYGDRSDGRLSMDDGVED